MISFKKFIYHNIILLVIVMLFSLGSIVHGLPTFSRCYDGCLRLPLLFKIEGIYKQFLVKDWEHLNNIFTEVGRNSMTSIDNLICRNMPKSMNPNYCYRGLTLKPEAFFRILNSGLLLRDLPTGKTAHDVSPSAWVAAVFSHVEDDSKPDKDFFCVVIEIEESFATKGIAYDIEPGKFSRIFILDVNQGCYIELPAWIKAKVGDLLSFFSRRLDCNL